MNLQTKNLKVGFIGGGNIVKAIAIPLIEKGILLPKNIWVSAKTQATLDFWNSKLINTTINNAQVIEDSDVIFLAVKPQMLSEVLDPWRQLDQNIFKYKLFVSVIAGVPLIQLTNKLGFIREPKIMRTLPNTALTVAEGITVYCYNEYTSEVDILPVVEIFSVLGLVQKLPEFQIDTAGALSGSGPAYAYLMIDALADGAVKKGLPRALAIKLAAKVFAGAGKMILETGQHPAQLKDNVCSPGGTTIAGIHALEQGGVRAALMNAIEATSARSEELGSQR